MNRILRIVLVVGGAVAAVVLLLVLRDGGDDGGSGTTVPTATSTQTTGTTTGTTTTGTTTTRTSPTPSALRIGVAVRRGRVVGGPQRFTARKGRRIVLLVKADLSDEVHVHGYDLKRDVSPGSPARITFRAVLPGRFEIELEERSLRIAELQVRP